MFSRHLKDPLKAMSRNREVHLVKRPTAEDKELEKFIAAVANSFVKIELIKFFFHNPHFLGTVQDVSMAIGRDPKRVSKGIDDLVTVGIIQKKGHKSGSLWTYTPDETLQKKITHFIKAYEGPDLRQWIVNKVIRGGG
jgi:hypothetical protein